MRTASTRVNLGRRPPKRSKGAGRAGRDTNLCAGFSLPELTIVVVIVLIICAIAIPSFLRMMNAYQLTATARSVSDLLERARYEAIKQNTKITCHFSLGAVPQSAWVDVNGTGTLAGNDPKVFYTAQVLSTGSALPPVSSMNFPVVTPVTNSGVIVFDSRGAVDFTAVPGGPTVWVLYFTLNNDPSYGAKAVTAEPFGRSRVWFAPPSSTWQAQ